MSPSLTERNMHFVARAYAPKKRPQETDIRALSSAKKSKRVKTLADVQNVTEDAPNSIDLRSEVKTSEAAETASSSPVQVGKPAVTYPVCRYESVSSTGLRTYDSKAAIKAELSAATPASSETAKTTSSSPAKANASTVAYPVSSYASISSTGLRIYDPKAALNAAISPATPACLGFMG